MRGYLRMWKQNLPLLIAGLVLVGIIVAVIVLIKHGHRPPSDFRISH